MFLIFKFLLSVLLFILSSVIQCRSQSAYLCPLVRVELKEAFRDAWKLDDIASLHYAVSSYAVLNEKIPVAAQDVCTYIKKVLASTESLEALYHVTAIAKDVPACASSQLLSDAGKKILSASEKTGVTMEDLYYIALSLRSVTSNITDTSSISKMLKDALKSNETLLNLGYAFHVGSLLPKRDIETLYDKIDTVISQVDEVDSKYYQFEGGLTLTALIVEGIYKLSETLGKAPPLTNTQLVKFFDYFLSRLSVSRSRGVFALLQVLSKLNDNKFHVYVTVGAVEDHLISKSNPKIQVRVSDVFGEPAFKDATALTVTFTSGKRSTGNQPITTSKVLSPSTDKKTYTTTITDLNLTPDVYSFAVSVVAGKSSEKAIVNGGQQTVKFKVTYKAKVENLQIGVLDSEQSSTSNLKKLEYPNKIKEELNIDSQQRLTLKFSLVDLDFAGTYKIQQAFVKLIDKQSKHEATFVCSLDSNRNYKISIDPSSAKTALEFVSGDYDLVLIVGDVLITDSIQWTLATVKFKHASEQFPAKNDYIEYYYKPKPEIKHLFKEPERRPPAIVSSIFTGLVLTPLIILLALWFKLGINLKNFPFSLSALGFHAGLGGIFALFGIFWLKLNMFQTIKYLLLLGVVTFLSGNKMLCSIASKRKK